MGPPREIMGGGGEMKKIMRWSQITISWVAIVAIDITSGILFSGGHL